MRCHSPLQPANPPSYIFPLWPAVQVLVGVGVRAISIERRANPPLPSFDAKQHVFLAGWTMNRKAPSVNFIDPIDKMHNVWPREQIPSGCFYDIATRPPLAMRTYWSRYMFQSDTLERKGSTLKYEAIMSEAGRVLLSPTLTCLLEALNLQRQRLHSAVEAAAAIWFWAISIELPSFLNSTVK